MKMLLELEDRACWERGIFEDGMKPVIIALCNVLPMWFVKKCI